jgi:hypothetical protein
MIYKNNNIQINFTDTTKKGFTGTTIFDIILGVIPISGNTFKNMDTFYVEGLFSSSISGSTGSIKLYVGSGETLTGAQQIMNRSVASGSVFQIQERTIHIVRANGAFDVTPDAGTNFAASGTGIVTDFRSTTSTIASIDWTKDKFIFFTTSISAGATGGSFIDQYYIKVWTE